MRDYNQIVSLETFTTVTCIGTPSYMVEYFILHIFSTSNLSIQ